MTVVQQWVKSGDTTIGRATRLSLAVGVAGLVVCLIGLIFSREYFFRAYLWAWLLCLAAALGSMAIVMLHHLTGGAWGWLVRRPAEAAAMTMPLLLVLFIPIAIGVGYLYPWARPEEVAGDAILQHRRVIFTTGFTILRSFVYLLIWTFWAWRLRGLSLAHDQTGDPSLLIRLRNYSGAGFVVYFATMSLAAMDWIASREVNWYSSTFGLAVLCGQAVCAVAVMILVLALLREVYPFQGIAEPGRVHDIGNLLLTCVVLWAYVEFAQLLVIWMSNTQGDNIWYIHRTHHGWWWVSLALIFLHFAVPFVLLLFQPCKRDIRALAWIAGGLLVMRAVDILWMVAPSNSGPEPRGINWMDFIAPIGIGGVWFAYFLWLLGGRPMMPLGHRVPVDPLATNYGGEQQQSQPVA